METAALEVGPQHQVTVGRRGMNGGVFAQGGRAQQRDEDILMRRAKPKGSEETVFRRRDSERGKTGIHLVIWLLMGYFIVNSWPLMYRDRCRNNYEY